MKWTVATQCYQMHKTRISNLENTQQRMRNHHIFTYLPNPICTGLLLHHRLPRREPPNKRNMLISWFATQIVKSSIFWKKLAPSNHWILLDASIEGCHHNLVMHRNTNYYLEYSLFYRYYNLLTTLSLSRHLGSRQRHDVPTIDRWATTTHKTH